MPIFFKKTKEKSYLTKTNINLRDFYHEFFIKILSSKLIPENALGLNGNLFLDFKNQNITEFFNEITVILTSGNHKTNQDLIKAFEDYFQKISNDSSKKTDEEFQNFFQGVKEEFKKKIMNF